MGERRYPTELSFRGPWLLDADALQQFDELISEAWQRLESRRKQIIETAFQDKLRELEKRESYLLDDLETHEQEIRTRATPYWADRTQRELQILLADGSSFVCESFAHALKDRSLVDQVPVAFKLDIESANIRCRVYLSRSRESLQIDITPEEEPEARELFVTLRQWAVDHRPSRWHRLWGGCASAGAHWSFWLLGIVVTFFVSVITAPSSPVTDEAKNRAWQMLDQGLTAANIPDALEILLILETDYGSAPNYRFPSWFIIFAITSTLAVIILSIRPKTVLGIGQGRQIVSRWRTWFKFLDVTLPTLFFSNVVWPALVRLFNVIF